MCGGEEGIIERDRTLREEFKAQGVVPYVRLNRPAPVPPAVASLNASALIVLIEGEAPWVSLTQATLMKLASKSPEAL